MKVLAKQKVSIMLDYHIHYMFVDIAPESIRYKNTIIFIIVLVKYLWTKRRHSANALTIIHLSLYF